MKLPIICQQYEYQPTSQLLEQALGSENSENSS